MLPKANLNIFSSLTSLYYFISVSKWTINSGPGYLIHRLPWLIQGSGRGGRLTWFLAVILSVIFIDWISSRSWHEPEKRDPAVCWVTLLTTSVGSLASTKYTSLANQLVGNKWNPTMNQKVFGSAWALWSLAQEHGHFLHLGGKLVGFLWNKRSGQFSALVQKEDEQKKAGIGDGEVQEMEDGTWTSRDVRHSSDVPRESKRFK